MPAPSQFNRDGRRFDFAFLLAVVAAFGLCLTEPTSSASNHSGRLLPPRLTAHSQATRHFEYVFGAGGIQVYDIDHSNRYLGQIAFPSLPIRGLSRTIGGRDFVLESRPVAPGRTPGGRSVS